MGELFDAWAGSVTREELQHLTREQLLQQVTNLYNGGSDWQQDGSPATVADQLWDEIHSARR